MFPGYVFGQQQRSESNVVSKLVVQFNRRHRNPRGMERARIRQHVSKDVSQHDLHVGNDGVLFLYINFGTVNIFENCFLERTVREEASQKIFQCLDDLEFSVPRVPKFGQCPHLFNVLAIAISYCLACAVRAWWDICLNIFS